MAATRLRKTFQYPTESDDEDAVEEGMDEKDQEDLITKLSTNDTSSTSLYTTILLALPLAPILLYVPRLFSLDTVIPSFAAIASLLASAYILYFLPLPPVKYTAQDTTPSSNKGKGKMVSLSPQSSGSIFSAPTSRPVPYVSEEVCNLLRRYIISGNGGLTVLLAVVELAQGRTWSEGMMIGGGYVPGLILTVVLWARRELRAVDLGELERLRYSTKSG